MSSALPPPTVVSDGAGLDELLMALKGERVIAVDTEADAFFSYHQKLCLVQITASQRDWLVDPLADLDLSPLGEMLADPERVKVLHDAEFDILLLGGLHEFRLAGLFDTRVAAAVLGSANPGLANVLSARFDVQLDKSMQRSDWSKRPLSEKQIDYARLDTHYLPDLYEMLYAECVERDRLMIVESECRRLEQLRPVPTDVQPDDFVRVKGARDLNPVQRAVFKELFVLRDNLAQKSDKPTFRVISNQALLDVARRRPDNYRALTAIKGFTSRMATRMGDEVLDAVVRGLGADPIERLPRAPRKAGALDLDEATQELHERLKRWRKKAADSLGIESAYVLNRHLLGRLAQERPDSLESLRAIEGIQDWQLSRFGDGIISVVLKFLEEESAGLLPKKRKKRLR